MKYLLPLVCLVMASAMAYPQWSDTTNLFKDSLHMSISGEVSEQGFPFIVRSYPDGGHFIIWEDTRNGVTNKTDIYAQKINSNGVNQWTTGGAPVATGPTDQRYERPQNVDYRNFSYACTDSAGGFYIAFEESVQIGSYNYYQVRVQHILSNGSRVFGDEGNLLAAADGATGTSYALPQLIADGNKGFFVGYTKHTQFDIDMYLFCYRDEGGTLRYYGGGQMDVNGINAQRPSPCLIQNYIINNDARIGDWYIWPDLNNGCNIVMTMGFNTGDMEVGYNRLVRVKKDCQATQLRRRDDVAVTYPTTKVYKKDSVVQLYNYTTFFYTNFCGGTPAYSTLNTLVENGGNGYQMITAGRVYNVERVKGITMPTTGNINVDIIAYTQRDLINGNTVGSWYTPSIYLPSEADYDSIPYQLCTDLTTAYWAYRYTPTTVLDKINRGRQDLLKGTNVPYSYDFNLAGGGKKVFLSANIYADGVYSIFLQQLRINRKSTDSFAVEVNTANAGGVVIGKSVSTGFTGTNQTFQNPMVKVDAAGNALFFINEWERSVRVSPVGDGADLLWGAMGRKIGIGYYAGYPYGTLNPTVAWGDKPGTAVLTWSDQRAWILNSGTNVFMRHLDSLTNTTYLPPATLSALLYPGVNTAFPGYMAGTSGKWTLYESSIYVPLAGGIGGFAPIAELQDTYPLGAVTVSTYQHSGTIRSTNGKPYLNRNYTIAVQNNPNGAATVPIRLYFTNAEYDALVAADPTILSPAYLGVVKQPGSSGAPAVYTPVGGETELPVKSWKAVPGGYYIEIEVSSFSYFFVMKSAAPLPVTWLGIDAVRLNDQSATVSWLVAQEENVKDYNAQVSSDGTHFVDGCTVLANNIAGTSTYSCIVPAAIKDNWYFRVVQTDIDGAQTYSKIVRLKANGDNAKLVIAPNPAQRYAEVRGLDAATVKAVQLYNSQGVLVWKNSGAGFAQGNMRVPMTALASGIYNLHITTSEGVSNFRIVKQ